MGEGRQAKPASCCGRPPAYCRCQSPRGHAHASCNPTLPLPLSQLDQDSLRDVLSRLDPASLARAAASCRPLYELSRSVVPGILLKLYPHQVDEMLACACCLAAAMAAQRGALLGLALLAWDRPSLQCHIPTISRKAQHAATPMEPTGRQLEISLYQLYEFVMPPSLLGAARRAAVDATAGAGVRPTAASHDPRFPVPGAAPAAGRRRCRALLHTWPAVLGRHCHRKAAHSAAACAAGQPWRHAV